MDVDLPHSTTMHKRVIIHFDIDYFYAQVEVLKNPSLVNKPFGVKQKNVVVTSNYIAREFGIKKCMLVTEALESCPNLVLVPGEDLSDYRTYSNRITDMLRQFVPKVEKLGLDENFIDVTSLIEEKEVDNELEIVGHTYGELEETCDCGCYKRLCIGSKIANNIRNSIKESIGLTTSCGISYNKLLAKLVGNKNKPFQQTTVFPCNALSLVSSLKNVHYLPGVGERTWEILSTLQIESISDLRNANISTMIRVLNSSLAETLKKLAFSIDDSPVKDSEKQKSLGLEDACRIDNKDQLFAKIQELLRRLQILIIEDSRIPSVVKVTIRKLNYSKGNTRESRQSFINFNPKHNFHEKDSNVMKLILHLIGKIVNLNKEFHLTLLGISFTKFSSSSLPSTIDNFLKSHQKLCKVKTLQTLDTSNKIIREDDIKTNKNSLSHSNKVVKQSEDNGVSEICQSMGYDESIFNQLPKNIQNEFITQARQSLKKSPKKQKTIECFFK